MKTLLIPLIIVFLFQTGCATINQKLTRWLGGKTPAEQAASAKPMTYSDNDNMPPFVRRKYKRTTRKTMAKEAQLDAHAGSLWVMEGQGAYLFTQNIMRLVGDPLGVRIDGEPREQLKAKVDVIHDLLDQIKQRQEERKRQLASANASQPEAKPKKTAKPEKEDQAKDFNVKIVPTRIVERTVDGNYRVKGSQPFMIGSREYKVIVTGVVRAEDFSDDGISATKLLDPKFDIVSSKHKEAM